MTLTSLQNDESQFLILCISSGSYSVKQIPQVSMLKKSFFDALSNAEEDFLFFLIFLINALWSFVIRLAILVVMLWTTDNLKKN